MKSNEFIFEKLFPDVITGKNILVTGGTTGIGRATALLLASMGNNVIICGRHEQELEDTKDDFQKLNSNRGSLEGITVDLGNEEGVVELFSYVKHKFSNLHVLINNAALAINGVEEGTYPEQEYVVKTNLLGYIACSKEAIELMKKTGRGHIVNVGSMSADVREEGSSVYVATKAGVQAFSHSLRKEVNDKGIKISLIEPGATGTDMQPIPPEEQEQLERKMEMLTAEDVASAIVYTLSQPERCDILSIQLRPRQQKL